MQCHALTFVERLETKFLVPPADAEMLHTSQEASQSTMACTHATSHMFVCLRPTVRRCGFKIGKALSHTYTHARKNSEYAIVEATGLADSVLHPRFFRPSSPYPIHPKKAVNYTKPTGAVAQTLERNVFLDAMKRFERVIRRPAHKLGGTGQGALCTPCPCPQRAVVGHFLKSWIDAPQGVGGRANLEPA